MEKNKRLTSADLRRFLYDESGGDQEKFNKLLAQLQGALDELVDDAEKIQSGDAKIAGTISPGGKGEQPKGTKSKKPFIRQ